jgi:uncharacterized Rossmann fold enzyme
MSTALNDKPVSTLTLEQDLKISYCIQDWLRNEQIRVNTAHVKGRIQPIYELRSDAIAVVNFGPSLNDTWEQIRDFKFVISCSGSHKFLVERGITPNFHVEVDPRKHKIELIGEPQRETEYLIASTCHPKLFDHLSGFNVKLWHIFDTTAEGLRMLPPGEWSITGGCSAGLRCLAMARFLGFTKLHVFGMDGCESEKYGKHAAAHPNQPKSHSELVYEGTTYWTTPSMLEAARQTFHEMDMLNDTEVVFHGEGLVQAMAKNYVRKSPKAANGMTGLDAFVGFSKPELISAHYRQMNEQLHQKNLAYGVGGGKHADTVKKLVKILQKTTEFVSVLDYGCGRGYLAKALPFPIGEYDPAVAGKTDSPRPADLVACTDVLEHIEPDRLMFVLDDLRRCVKQLGYFVIHTKASKKTLPDGRNAHLIQQNKEWWMAELQKFFKIGTIREEAPLLYVVVAPK